MMTEYNKLIDAERYFNTICIVERETRKTGIAYTCEPGSRGYDEGRLISAIYGTDDGSDDRYVSPEVFNEEFQVTGAFHDPGLVEDDD